MADQIVITEKTSQAKDVRAAVGSRYGDILPAEGHLLDLLEPEDVVPAWKRWSPILLRPEGLYGTRPAEGGNRAAKLKAIREALRTAKRVWLATDCDREGQLIGQEILEHYNYRGQVMRVLFTAQDSQTIRDAFGRAKPNAEYAPLYAAAVARRQADQIYNLSLTRTATVILGRGARGVIGVGRVKTPTLAIACRRELEIRNFVPRAYFEVVATAIASGGQLIKDRQTLLTFFDLPADHWDHLRTSNPIESVFATVRHRTVRMKGALSQDTARLMVFKLVMAASRTWRRLKGQNQLPKVVNGLKFKDGIETGTEIKSAA